MFLFRIFRIRCSHHRVVIIVSILSLHSLMLSVKPECHSVANIGSFRYFRYIIDLGTESEVLTTDELSISSLWLLETLECVEHVSR